jgi:tetratricopeptide (TPR) repeat protein
LAIAPYNRVLFLLLFSAMLLRASQPKGQPPSGQDDVTQHFRAAQEDIRAGRFDAAIDQFKRVLRLDPSLTEARVNLGLAYHATGDYRLAVAELSQASKQAPDLLPASLFLGLCYLKLGSPRQAIPPLDHALALDASNQEARRARATAELAEGDYAQAQRHFRYLFAAADVKADGWFILGRDYLQMAKQLSTQFTAQFPNSAWSLRLAGDVLAERSLWNDAIHSYRKAVSADPIQPGLHAALGDALLSAGKSQEATSEFDLEFSRHPFETAALLGMAEVNLLNGDPQSALQNLRRIWQTAPEVLGEDADFPSLDLSAARRAKWPPMWRRSQ